MLGEGKHESTPDNHGQECFLHRQTLSSAATVN
jgi:hypothetical protein